MFILKYEKTAGSAANLRLISQEYVDIAFVQSDVMKDAYNGTGYFDKEYKGYSAIAVVIYRGDTSGSAERFGYKFNKRFIRKKCIAWRKRIGVLQNSKQILSAYGLNESMVDAKYLSYTDAAKAMKNENLDAFFCTAGTPTCAITEISDDIKLIPIDGTVADRLTEQYNGYVKHTIKANTYDGQTEDIETLGVKMVLIASDEMSDDRVKSITKNIFDNSNKFGFAKDDTFDMNFATENVTIPFQQRCKRILCGKRSKCCNKINKKGEMQNMNQISLDMYQTLGMAVAVLFLGAFLKKRIKFLETFCIPSPVVAGLIFAIVSCILYATGILEISFDETLKNVCMVIFFTSVGFQANLKVLKSGGLSLVVFLVCVIVLIISQNLVSVGLAKLVGVSPLIGLSTGSIPMGSAARRHTAGAFGPVLEDLGISGARQHFVQRRQHSDW